MTGNGNSCGTKHLKLALGIIAIVATACYRTADQAEVASARAQQATKDLGDRVMQLEKNDAANTARYEAIKESLMRLERQQKNQ